MLINYLNYTITKYQQSAGMTTPCKREEVKVVEDWGYFRRRRIKMGLQVLVWERKGGLASSERYKKFYEFKKDSHIRPRYGAYSTKLFWSDILNDM